MERRIERALLSVSDKRGLEGFARSLSQSGVELIATGGTRRMLLEAGLDVREVAEVTGFPEMMNGRVKTLHPRIHGGILARRDDPEHLAAMEEHGIPGIDMVVVNLYPFQATVARDGVTREEAVEQIDIGGPCMVRAAAKSHRDVAVVVDPDDYGAVLDELQTKDGALSGELRRRLAVKAFGLTARYDAAISEWLFAREADDGLADAPHTPSYSLAGVKALDLRYGENPHQTAAFYRCEGATEPSVATAELLGGKALSYNNLVDLDAALALAKEFDQPFVCVCKHNNPCGAACGATPAEALADAWAGDPMSAFGSVLAFNRNVDLASAEFLTSENRFVEAIVAPGFDDDALECLRTRPKWGRSVRLLACGEFDPGSRRAEDVELKRLVGGFLVQSRDLARETADDLQIPTQSKPDDEQLAGMLFANLVAKHVKSNAIVIAKGRRVLGVGAGQMSRVDAVRIAIEKAGDEIQGSVLASDAFFPFPDGVETAMEAGVGAILQPGGSRRDDAVVASCDERSVPMVFTGSRHFRH
jgi:phosphoribosylaminoimidazolecarboxamide formyltransferase/IMP cyclohydrolase